MLFFPSDWNGEAGQYTNGGLGGGFLVLEDV